MTAPTRRGILSAIAIAPVVIATPAIAVHTTPIDRAIADYNRARDYLNNAPADVSFAEDERRAALYTQAMHRLMDTAPTDGGQLARKIAALWQDDGDMPTEASFAMILHDARLLAS